MQGAHAFLEAITIVLCVAAVTTVVFQRLRQPVVLGYILAGLIVGPHVPIPLVADREIIQILSELGVILLMFSLGLEFRLRKLVQLGPTAGITAVIQSSIMISLGFMAGQLFGWTTLESIFAGALIAISSTTIIAKAFDEQGVRGKLRDLVVGVLIVEDLIAILLMAILTALSSGGGVSAGTVLRSSGRLAAFLAVLVLVGVVLVPRAVRGVVRLKRQETTLVASVGFCFAVALLAQAWGYSVALGAFIAGTLVAESGEEKIIEHLIVPVRDMFAAIFFVSVGMLIDPAIIAEHWLAVLTFTVLVILGKLVGVTIGAFLTGAGVRTSVRAGMSLAQIGEFSFIIASLGLTLKATGEFLYPVAVAVSAITTLTTPWLIKVADPFASYVDRKLPRPLQTFAALYGAWIEQLRPQRGQNATSETRRLVKLLLLDVGLLILLLISTGASAEAIAAWSADNLSLSPTISKALVFFGAVLLSIPLTVGIFRVTKGLGAVLFNRTEGHLMAPRRALVVTLQLAVVFLVGLPILALPSPFLPRWASGLALGLALIGLGAVFWRSAQNLQGHVKAGAEILMETLLAESNRNEPEPSFVELRALMPGLGEPIPFRLKIDNPAVGKTLAELNLRGLTGASVVAIARGEAGILVPTANETLRGGDILALVGAQDAVAAAISLLEHREEPISG